MTGPADPGPPVRSTLAYLGLGGTLGDRRGLLRQAVARLGPLGVVRTASALYDTDPVGYLAQPAFLNAVVGLETDLPPAALVAALLGLERAMGRQRSFPNAPRPIDLDLLLYADVVVATAQVTVPHPRMHERAFVLVPLVEIAPDVVHPVFQLSAQELLRRLGATPGVRKTPDALMP